MKYQQQYNLHNRTLWLGWRTTCSTVAQLRVTRPKRLSKPQSCDVGLRKQTLSKQLEQSRGRAEWGKATLEPASALLRVFVSKGVPGAVRRAMCIRRAMCYTWV